ncbi:MAG: dinitrogenase iron-molybdenum cofactor biosynthesis protein [bacterium]|nr:dinitrogenase iron-molybdenum cofactor biosynthesis protein [bacterium]
MKIAITTTGDSLQAPLDMRFGRAVGFLIYDLDKGTAEFVSNSQNLNAAQGAGIQAAQTLVATGAEGLITGHCGPKAFQVLEAAGVAVFNTRAANVDEALTLYKKGDLTAVASADVEGHWT